MASSSGGRREFPGYIVTSSEKLAAERALAVRASVQARATLKWPRAPVESACMRITNAKPGRRWTRTVAVVAMALAVSSAGIDGAHAQVVGDAYSFAGPATPIVLDGATVIGRRALPVGTYVVTITGVVANGNTTKAGQVLCTLEGQSGDLIVEEVPSWLHLAAAPPGDESYVSWSATTTVTIAAGGGRVRALCENRSTVADTDLSVFGVRLVAVRLASERRRS